MSEISKKIVSLILVLFAAVPIVLSTEASADTTYRLAVGVVGGDNGYYTGFEGGSPAEFDVTLTNWVGLLQKHNASTNTWAGATDGIQLLQVASGPITIKVGAELQTNGSLDNNPVSAITTDGKDTVTLATTTGSFFGTPDGTNFMESPLNKTIKAQAAFTTNGADDAQYDTWIFKSVHVSGSVNVLTKAGNTINNVSLVIPTSYENFDHPYVFANVGGETAVPELPTQAAVPLVAFLGAVMLYFRKRLTRK